MHIVLVTVVAMRLVSTYLRMSQTLRSMTKTVLFWIHYICTFSYVLSSTVFLRFFESTKYNVLHVLLSFVPIVGCTYG